MKINLDKEKHIDKKLTRRIRMLTVILFAMAIALMYEIYVSQINILWVLLGIIFGITIGFLAGRMFSIEWHEDEKKVIGKLDLIGGIILGIYIVFSVARHWIFAHWFTGAILSAFTISFVGGAMLGRIISMRINIKKVLIEQGKI